MTSSSEESKVDNFLLAVAQTAAIPNMSNQFHAYWSPELNRTLISFGGQLAVPLENGSQKQVSSSFGTVAISREKTKELLETLKNILDD